MSERDFEGRRSDRTLEFESEDREHEDEGVRLVEREEHILLGPRQ